MTIVGSRLAALLAAAPVQDLPDPVMDTGGWLFLGLAWVAVTGLLVWSFVRVMTGGKGPGGETS